MAVGAFFNGPLLQEENGHSHGGEVRILLDDRSRREARKQNRRYCCPSLVVLITILLVLAVVLGVSLGTASILNRLPNDPHERALALLKQYPLIDGYALKSYNTLGTLHGIELRKLCTLECYMLFCSTNLMGHVQNFLE